MRVLYLFATCLLVNLSISAQEVTMQDLLDIVYCKDVDECFMEVVNKLSYDRYDADKEESGYTANNGAGTKKVYGPVDGVQSRINSFRMVGYNWKHYAIIYTDDYDHWFDNFYKPISKNDNFIRKPNLEGESKYEDWVYIPSGYPGCKIMFIKTPDNIKGNYCITVVK